jgi:hypothetical protein
MTACIHLLKATIRELSGRPKVFEEKTGKSRELDDFKQLSDTIASEADPALPWSVGVEAGRQRFCRHD